jgi:hypothetical protein
MGERSQACQGTHLLTIGLGQNTQALGEVTIATFIPIRRLMIAVIPA